TAKFPRDPIAFKWQDEIRETRLLEIEWSPSRTGLINPIAVFEPVELEGTTVSRASVHNLSIMKALKLGIGDTVKVYKANMIIPQIAENLTGSDTVRIPETCPVCAGKTEIRDLNGVQTLYCTNEQCSAKKIKSFTLFVSRDAMNIEGLSEATLEKFIARGFIHSFADIFHLDREKEAIVEMEGFGEKSYANLMQSIRQARHTTLPRLIYSLGIPNIGVANAKLLCRHFDYDLGRIRSAAAEEIAEVEGLGEVIAASVCAYFSDAVNRENLDALLCELELEQVQAAEYEQIFSGKTFVITGSVTHFTNRNELKAYIEERGGKVTGSVSRNTDYLINNDVNSASSKNKKARELEIPILSEADFLSLAEGSDK
ncbi:MAG: helix-hairpin-helix domain-containing protein, partial [Lachnospiraceae bacterium]